MSAPVSHIPELEEVLHRGSPQRRADTLRRITAFFLDGASRFNEDHVRLFDEVLGRLIIEIETRARMELSHRLAPLGNAPPEVVRRLARDDDIAVAGPILAQSPRIAEADLVDIARTKSQAHLLAISGRIGIGEPVTEVLVRRGDHEVARKVAGNCDAKLSEDSFSQLVERAEQDGVLAEKVGRRTDIPPRLFRDLLLRATEVVQQRLFASANPEVRAEIKRVLAKVSHEVGASRGPRDYSAAQRHIEALYREGKLDEAALVDFAQQRQFENVVAALACLCAVPIEVVDRLMTGDRPDPVLILGKSAGWGWPTVKAIITAWPGGQGTSSQGLDAAYANFDRLSATTSQRVMRFWQARPQDRR
jgi:uncharacterized protein (DUF2336 family)